MTNVRLFHGDCLDILPTLEAGSVDAMILDLPYGTTACKWDEVIPFAPMWAEVKRVLKQRGVFVTTASQPFTSALVMSNPDWFRYTWVWQKQQPTGFLDAQRRPLRSHEDVLVFGETMPAYHPQGTMPVKAQNARKNKSGQCYGHVNAESYTQSIGNFPRTVITFDKVSHDQLHPTQKPVALYEYLIRTYTNEGDTVLDFCAGSFTTGVACVNTNRNFIGIEKERNYFELGTKRIEQAQAQMPLLELV